MTKCQSINLTNGKACHMNVKEECNILCDRCFRRVRRVKNSLHDRNSSNIYANAIETNKYFSVCGKYNNIEYFKLEKESNTLKSIYLKQNSCVYCNKYCKNLNNDHFIPVIKDKNIFNFDALNPYFLLTCCARCNISRGNKQNVDVNNENLANYLQDIPLIHLKNAYSVNQKMQAYFNELDNMDKTKINLHINYLFPEIVTSGTSNRI